MENASQALLIAAGILMGLIILTVIIFGFRQVSNYYAAKEQNKASEQLIAFNKQYNTYDREDVRGTELISLIYKIIDFNNIQNDANSNIEIDVNIKDKDNKWKNMYYQYDTYKNIKLIDFTGTYNGKYTQDNIDGEILQKARNIEAKYPSGLADKLAKNISKLLDADKKDNFLKELKINNPNSVDEEDILKYYQYQQFKRAHFDCTSLKYTDAGRVLKFEFEFNGKFE